MHPLLFYIKKNDFNTKVGTWLGFIAWQQDKKIFYNFNVMKPTKKGPSTSRKNLEDLSEGPRYLFKKDKECVSLAYVTSSDIDYYA